jgi:tRNA-specific 2-thiouridylase
MRVVEELGVKLHVVPLHEEYLEMVKNPRHGYGSNMNPCIDCRILMFRRAKERMGEIGASFIVTGEVLGQRPMSQHKEALATIEREAGLEGLVLRPLSSKVLPPTKPEKEGLVDRERFLSIRGRSRKKQIELAKSYRISGYSCPSGGCLLTDRGFAGRLRDLMRHCPNPGLNDIELLKVGRHFRLSPAVKLVVGRNERENERLRSLCNDGDALFEVPDCSCPVSIARGSLRRDELLLSARIEARYSDVLKDRPVNVTYRMTGGQAATLTVMPCTDEELKALRAR